MGSECLCVVYGEKGTHNGRPAGRKEGWKEGSDQYEKGKSCGAE